MIISSAGGADSFQFDSHDFRVGNTFVGMVAGGCVRMLRGDVLIGLLSGQLFVSPNYQKNFDAWWSSVEIPKAICSTSDGLQSKQMQTGCRETIQPSGTKLCGAFEMRVIANIWDACLSRDWERWGPSWDQKSLSSETWPGPSLLGEFETFPSRPPTLMRSFPEDDCFPGGCVLPLRDLVTSVVIVRDEDAEVTKLAWQCRLKGRQPYSELMNAMPACRVHVQFHDAMCWC